MKKITITFSLVAVLMLQAIFAGAQTEPVKHKIAIFAPLYLDSATNELGEYNYAKYVFPKFFNPGLEFYEGAQLALDSLKKEKAPLEVFVFDTKSSESIHQQLNKEELKDLSLIIAHCSSAEAKQLADAGLKRNIPVINANLPNDAGATENPFYVILNPTLRTQCEGIYKHIQKYYSLSPIVVFRKKGQLEDKIKEYFNEASKATMAIPLKLKYVDLIDSFTVDNLKSHLDSVTKTVVLAGSLDEKFGSRLIQQLTALDVKGYNTTIIGMPTWDGFAFTKPEFKGPEFVYSNPFYNAKLDKVSLSVTNHFNKIMFARPSDMVFRGYEVTWKFAKLLMQYGTDFSSNIGNKQHKVFTDFDIQPVLNRQTMSLDYFENKKLYFLKWHDGILQTVN